MNNPSLLARCIKEDFGLSGNGRWFKSDQHSSLVWDAEKDIYYWNSEGKIGDIYHYLTEVRHWSHEESKEFIKLNDGSGIFISVIGNKEEVIVYPKLVDIFHENLRDKDKTFFYSRGIKDDTISRFKLGWYNDYYTIPVYMGGVFRQIQLRKDNPKKITKYYKNTGALLFNSDITKIVNTVFIVESPVSAIILSQNGLPAVCSDSGANSFQPEWFSYFIGIKDIYILYDNDKAGNTGSINVAKILGEHRCKIYNFWDSGIDKYGADNYFQDSRTADDLINSIKEKGKYSFELEEKKRTYVKKGR